MNDLVILNKMPGLECLFHDRHEGIQVTVHSFREVVKYLLENGVQYVQSERFCQDDLENYFGRQRAVGRRKDYPSVRDVGYNDNTIKSQFNPSVRDVGYNDNTIKSQFNPSVRDVGYNDNTIKSQFNPSVRDVGYNDNTIKSQFNPSVRDVGYNDNTIKSQFNPSVRDVGYNDNTIKSQCLSKKNANVKKPLDVTLFLKFFL